MGKIEKTNSSQNINFDTRNQGEEKLKYTTSRKNQFHLWRE